MIPNPAKPSPTKTSPKPIASLLGLLLVCLIAVLTLAACSSDDDNSDSSTSTTSTQPPSSTSTSSLPTNDTSTTPTDPLSEAELQAELALRQLDSEDDRAALLMEYCQEIPAAYQTASDEFFSVFKDSLAVGVVAHQQAQQDIMNEEFASFETNLATSTASDHFDAVDEFFTVIGDIPQRAEVTDALYGAFSASLRNTYTQFNDDQNLLVNGPGGGLQPGLTEDGNSAEIFDEATTATFRALEAISFYTQLVLGVTFDSGLDSPNELETSDLETSEASGETNEEVNDEINEEVRAAEIADASAEARQLTANYLDIVSELGELGLYQNRFTIVDQVLFTEPFPNPLDDAARAAALVCAKTLQ